MKVPGIKYQQGRNAYTDQDHHKYGVAIHNTSNNASAQAEANYAQTRTDGVSSHFYVDGTTIIQSLDTASRAGHAGSSTGNENAIAFEIVGFNSNTRQWWLDNVAWDKIGYVIAYLKEHDVDFAGLIIARATVSEMRSNPKVRKLYAHDDMRQAWGGTTHTDPGPNFPWDRLYQAINDAYEGGPVGEWTEPEKDSTLMRVYGTYTDQDNVQWTKTDGTTATEANKLKLRLNAIDDALAAQATKLDEILAAVQASGGGGLAPHTHTGGETGDVTPTFP